MLPSALKIAIASISVLLFGAFVYGLTQSILVGFAGFSGGLPVFVIVTIVFAMAVYDVWNETIRKP